MERALKRSRGLYWGIGCLSVFLALILLFSGWVLWNTDPYQWRREKAEDLAMFYRAHRELFSQMNAIVIADHAHFNENGDLHINTTSPADRARFEALRDSLGRPNPGAVVESASSIIPPPVPQTVVQYDYRWGGDDNNGPFWSEGIIYLEHGAEKDQQVVKDLDAVGKGPGPGFFVSHIEGPWYVFFYKFG